MPSRYDSGHVLANWWPATVMMAAIFALSSRPSDVLPDLGWADLLTKKGGHVLGYAALAATYWRALGWNPRRFWIAWALAAAYGLTDELHQVWAAGRHASAWDVILFDAPGALLGLWISRRMLRRRVQADMDKRPST